MSNMPDLEAWAIFARVAELRSFRAAAQSLGLSNATVSKAVTRLENRLGVRLFHRTTRTLSLTPSGQALVGRAAALLGDAEAAEEAARSEATGPHGLVRIAAPMSFGVRHVAPALPELLAACPGLAIDLRLSDATIDLVEAGIDIAIRIGTLADSALKVRRLADIEMLLCAAPAYIARQGAPATPADLASHACFSYSNAAQPDRWRLIGPKGIESVVQPRGPFTVDNGDAMVPALIAGLGIALLPDFIVGAELATGKLVRILPDWTAPHTGLHLVMPSAGPRPARISAVIDFFSQRFGHAA